MAERLNKKLFEEAIKYISGGVNSPARAFKAVGGSPLFIKKGKGARLYDVENKAYIDYCMSWGALILGHSHKEVIKQVRTAVEKGTSFGMPTPLETELAKEIHAAFPSIERVRLVNSGTEACMSAVRLARGYTQRTKIIKFSGCYHGHADCLLAQAGSGMAAFGIPDSPGVPEDFAKYTLVLPYNNLDLIEKTVKKYYKDIACIIIEPVAGNMGVVLPRRGFLKGLREICNIYEIVLIFDEVITGFRAAYGGAQEIYKIKPDLTCLGKIIGGGLPAGAFGGKKEIMENLAPAGGVYQAGTLSGNPVSVTAGLATLKVLRSTDGIYEELGRKTETICREIEKNAVKCGINVVINRIASMFTVFFTKAKGIYNYEAARQSNTGYYAYFFHKMLEKGVILPPSQFEACFVSLPHSSKDIEKTAAASFAAFTDLRISGK